VCGNGGATRWPELATRWWRRRRYHNYDIVDLKRQNRLKVGTDTHLKVKLQLVSDDARKKTSWKAVLSWRRKVYSHWEDVTSSGRVFKVSGLTTGTCVWRIYRSTINAVCSDLFRALTANEVHHLQDLLTFCRMNIELTNEHAYLTDNRAKPQNTPWVKKGRHYTLVHIFAKYWPIFTILSPTYLVGHLQ